ncbi:hypothetical protein BDQ12DRAFT_713501 [Crucibulum laeve]|uniref:Uncharacterized protein n=1 Tax=Crucibulum laeve TaxID=68775 RepID=A0A5C3LW78_9AGAR|nr:hypothetical protein BDQ12DRAFT_713501 [Crucibulum laeve]
MDNHTSNRRSNTGYNSSPSPPKFLTQSQSTHPLVQVTKQQMIPKPKINSMTQSKNQNENHMPDEGASKGFKFMRVKKPEHGQQKQKRQSVPKQPDAPPAPFSNFLKTLGTSTPARSQLHVYAQHKHSSDHEDTFSSPRLQPGSPGSSAQEYAESEMLPPPSLPRSRSQSRASFRPNDTIELLGLSTDSMELLTRANVNSDVLGRTSDSFDGIGSHAKNSMELLGRSSDSKDGLDMEGLYAEQNRRFETLLSQYTSLKSSHAALTKLQAQTLAELASTQLELTSAQAEVSSSQAKLSSTQSQLTTTESQLIEARDAVASTKERLVGMDILREETASLKTELSSRQQELGATKSELMSAHDALSASKIELAAHQADLFAMGSTLSSYKEEVKTKAAVILSADSALAAAQNELASDRALEASVREDLIRVKGELEEAKEMHEKDIRDREDAKRAVVKAKKSINEMGETYSTLFTSFKSLKKAHDSPQVTIQEVAKDLRETRKFATEALGSIEPLLNETGRYAKLADTKAIITELQDELAGSQRVTDLLRDKLHNLSTSLAEAQGRVKDLEEEKRSVWGILLERSADDEKRLTDLHGVEDKLSLLAERLVKQEHETFDALAEAAEGSIQLTATKKALEELESEASALKVAKEELLQQVNASQLLVKERSLEAESLKAEIGRLEKTLIDSNEELSKAQEGARTKDVALKDRDSVIHVQADELLSLRADIRNLESNLADSNIAAKKLREDLASLTLREAMATGKAELLEAQLIKARKYWDTKEEALKQMNSRILVLQERFDAQTVTLRLTKEQTGDLQDRLVLSESSAAAKLESATGKLKTEIAILQEQKSTLQVSLEELRKENIAKQVSLASTTSEFTSRLSKQESASERLVKTQEKRAVAAEREVTKWEKEAAKLEKETAKLEKEALDASKNAEQLETTVGGLRERVAQLEASEIAAGARLEELGFLEKRVWDLEEENDKLRHQAEGLMKRYEAGELTNTEKDFVNSVIQFTQSIHEQDVVAKDNELRRVPGTFTPYILRENMISNLQLKITTLESTVARMLKEKGKEAGPDAKPMIDLSMWMSSSPLRPVGDLVLSKPGAVQAVSGAPISTASQSVHAPKQSTTTPEDASPTPKKPVPSFAKLAGLESDDEDDIPLSELSQLTDNKRKRIRASSPVPIEEPVRTKRRLRGATAPKPVPVAPVVEKKSVESMKGRQKKRK